MGSNSLEQLDSLLSTAIEKMRVRETSMFDELARPFEKSIVLYGAGSLGRTVVRGLRSEGIEPRAFIDSNEELWNTSVDNVLIMSPAEAVNEFSSSAVFVVTIWSPNSGNAFLDASNTLRQFFSDIKVISFVPLFYQYPHVFLPYYCLDLPHMVLEQADNVRNAFLLLSDELSREEYISYLMFRFSGDFKEFKDISWGPQYFSLESKSNGEVFVDCGAYTGDTLKEFLRVYDDFDTYLAFEPDPDNFRQLAETIEGLPSSVKRKIKCFRLAVSNCNKSVFFEAKGTGSSCINPNAQEMEIACIDLDSIIANLNPTIIKMDIEGSEQDALEGAIKVIQDYRPKLAICAYHKPDDIWMIPLLINSYCKDYEFYYRRYEAEGWELVCYAIPR